MGKMIIYNIPLPSLDEPHDVVTRELTISYNDEIVDVRELAPDTGKVTYLQVSQDVEVDLELVDIDKAGNRSPAQWYGFMARDTIPPKQPKEFSVEIVGQEIVSDNDILEEEPTGEEIVDSDMPGIPIEQPNDEESVKPEDVLPAD